MFDHSRLLSARALRGTGSRCSWDPLTWHQHYQWSVNARGLVGTQAPQPWAVTRSAKRLSPCPGDLRGSVRQGVNTAPKWRLSELVLSMHTCLDQRLGFNVAYTSLFAFKLWKTRATNRLLHHSLKLFDRFAFFLKHSRTSSTLFCLLSLSSAGMNTDFHSLSFTGSR